MSRAYTVDELISKLHDGGNSLEQIEEIMASVATPDEIADSLDAHRRLRVLILPPKLQRRAKRYVFSRPKVTLSQFVDNLEEAVSELNVEGARG